MNSVSNIWNTMARAKYIQFSFKIYKVIVGFIRYAGLFSKQTLNQRNKSVNYTLYSNSNMDLYLECPSALLTTMRVSLDYFQNRGHRSRFLGSWSHKENFLQFGKWYVQCLQIFYNVSLRFFKLSLLPPLRSAVIHLLT